MTTENAITVAVTGATGLVGRAVVSRLVHSGKYIVVALGRNQAALDELSARIKAEMAAGGFSDAGGSAAESRSGSGSGSGSGTEGRRTLGDVNIKPATWGDNPKVRHVDEKDRLVVRICDVNDPESLGPALAGANVVVHAAGAVDVLADRNSIYKVNVEGTDNVLNAARAQKLTQMIHISSLSVITGQADQVSVDERATLVASGEPYADSKVEAERRLSSYMNSGSLAITILRPGFIYGPGERAWMPRLIDNIKHGRAALVDGGERETNVIYSGNLALAVECAILNTRAYGEVFNLTDGEKVTKRALFDEISEGLSLPLVQRSFPREVIKPVYAVMGALRPLFPRGMQPALARFSPGAYRLIAVNQGFSIRKAEQLLDYKNRISFKDGMERTLKEFR